MPVTSYFQAFITSLKPAQSHLSLSFKKTNKSNEYSHHNDMYMVKFVVNRAAMLRGNVAVLHCFSLSFVPFPES